MNQTQIEGLIREIVFALAAVFVSFNLFPETNVDLVGAGVVSLGMLIWGMIVKEPVAALISLLRKLIQTVSPVLVLYNVITPEQGATLTALVFSVISVLSYKSNANA